MSPDGSTKPSPEERLLRLIRGKGPAVPGAAPPARHSAAGSSPGATGGSGTAVVARHLQWPTIAAIGLGGVLVAEVGYLAIQLMRPLPPIVVPAAPEIPAAAPTNEAPSPVDVPPLPGSVSRPLFVSSLASTASTAPVASPQSSAPSAKANSLVTRLTLMGIVAGDPAQVVIEDTETKKTYFVTVGQAVAEGAVLEQVLDNRVILNLNGEKIPLSL